MAQTLKTILEQYTRAAQTISNPITEISSIAVAGAPEYDDGQISADDKYTILDIFDMLAPSGIKLTQNCTIEGYDLTQGTDILKATGQKDLICLVGITNSDDHLDEDEEETAFGQIARFCGNETLLRSPELKKGQQVWLEAFQRLQARIVIDFGKEVLGTIEKIPELNLSDYGFSPLSIEDRHTARVFQAIKQIQIATDFNLRY